MTDGEDLKQGAHFRRIDQPFARRVDIARLCRGRPLRELLCANLDTEPPEKIALGDGTMDPGGPSRIGQGGEIHMGGDVRAAGIHQKIVRRVVSHRLERVCRAVPAMTVIDNQGRAAEFGDAIRDRGGD